MKIITGSRGSGVSTELLESAQKTGGIYICASMARTKDLERKYNNPNIKFTTLDYIAHNKLDSKFEKADVYIDDFEISLNWFLSVHGYKGKVKAVGTTWGIIP